MASKASKIRWLLYLQKVSILGHGYVPAKLLGKSCTEGPSRVGFSVYNSNLAWNATTRLAPAHELIPISMGTQTAHLADFSSYGNLVT